MEEAPVTWHGWRGQRTRWIKGWMQTYLVHIASPSPPLARPSCVEICRLSGDHFRHARIHACAPLVLYRGWSAWRSRMGVLPQSNALFWVCGTNLAAGYVSAALLIAVTSARSGISGRLFSVVFLPIYWLAISYTAYRAIWDLVQRPFFWEKTTHGARQKASTRSSRETVTPPVTSSVQRLFEVPLWRDPMSAYGSWIGSYEPGLYRN